jgi:tetratricopeptide (TPR) repeat protein
MLSSTTPQQALRNAAGLLLIMVIVVICAWPGMTAPLFTDDIHQLEKAKHFASWKEIFGTDVFGFYRPVKNALFMALVPLEKNLVGWHWIGLIAYLAATAGIYRIVRICLDSPRAAWFAAFFWALSPACVSTAIWLSCANISIGLVFAACMFHFHERRALLPSFTSAAACLLFFALALVCYESMIAIPALLFIRDFQQRRLGIDRRTAVRYALYALVAVAFLYVRHLYSAKGIGNHSFHAGFAPDTKPIHLTLSSPWFLWRHFLMWIFPFGKIELLGSYAWLRSASPVSLVFGWVFLLTLLGAAAACWKRFPAVAYGLLFFVVASIPAGNFVPNFNGPINDAYLTIPSIGLAIACAALCEAGITAFLKRRNENATFIMTAALAIFLIYRMPLCCAYFRSWAGVWCNPTKLMLLSSETRPLQFQSKAFVSILLLGDGYLVPAESYASKVLEEAPWNASARLTLARIAVLRNDHRAAEDYYRFILKSPGVSPFLREKALFELAQITDRDPAKQEETANLLREHLKSTGKVPNPDAVAMLAKIYIAQGNTDKARATLERGLKAQANDPTLKSMLDSLSH